MAANFLHGVETIEIDSGPRPVKMVKTAVIGIVGTAAAGAVNTPILVTSERDFAQFGQDIPGSTILKALNRIYKQKGTVAIVINVLDPATHKTTLSRPEIVTVDQDGKFSLGHAAVVGDITLTNSAGTTTFVKDTDYSFDAATGTGLTINESNLVIYFSNSLKLVERLQSEDRNHRIGQKNDVLYIDLVCAGTKDVDVLNAIRDKKDVAEYVRTSMAKPETA